MVKLSGQQGERWVLQPNTDHWAVLLYGPNRGLVRDRAKNISSFLTNGHTDDPFLVATLDEAAIKADPGVLFTEAYSLALTGGNKIVRVSGATDKLATELDAILSSDSRSNSLIIEAADLPPRSKLRTLFEKLTNAASIACYDDDSSNLRSLITEKFRSQNISFDNDAVDALLARLSKDRLLNLSEIDKVCLFVGPGETVSENLIRLAIGESGGETIDDIVYLIFDGQKNLADHALAEGFVEGYSPVQIVRRLQSHLERLLRVRSLMDRGESIDRAMAKLRPPVFFKVKDRFRRQVTMWPIAQLQKCLDALIELEIECKSTGMPDAALCQRMSLSISGLAQKLGR